MALRPGLATGLPLSVRPTPRKKSNQPIQSIGRKSQLAHRILLLFRRAVVLPPARSPPFFLFNAARTSYAARRAILHNGARHVRRTGSTRRGQRLAAGQPRAVGRFPPRALSAGNRSAQAAGAVPQL